MRRLFRGLPCGAGGRGGDVFPWRRGRIYCVRCPACAGQRFIFAGQSALCPIFHALHEKYPICQAEAAIGRVLFHKWGGDVAASPPTPSRQQKIYIKEKET